MNLKVSLLFSLLFSLCFNASKSHSQLYDILIGDNLKRDAKEVINEMLNGVDALMKDALNRADYITEARLKEATLALNNFQYFISSERKKLLSDLDKERLAILKGIDQILADNIPSADELGDISALLTADIQNIVNDFNSWISSKDQFRIYKIKGISQEYKASGIYRISFIGNSFGQQDINSKIVVNGRERIIETGTSQNQVYVELQSSELNTLFKDTSTTRIPVEISSIRQKRGLFKRKKKKDTLLNFKSTILLHPKYPIQYRLYEIAKTDTLSALKFGQKKEKLTHNGRTTTIVAEVEKSKRIDSVIFFNPQEYIDGFKKAAEKYRNSQILSEQLHFMILTEALPKQIGGWTSSAVFFDDSTKVRREYLALSEIPIWVEVFYRDIVPGKSKYIERHFRNSQGNFLKNGTYVSEEFSKDYASFELNLKFFHSDWKLINPTNVSNEPGIKTAIQNGGITNLTLKIESSNSLR